MSAIYKYSLESLWAHTVTQHHWDLSKFTLADHMLVGALRSQPKVGSLNVNCEFTLHTFTWILRPIDFSRGNSRGFAFCPETGMFTLHICTRADGSLCLGIQAKDIYGCLMSSQCHNSNIPVVPWKKVDLCSSAGRSKSLRFLWDNAKQHVSHLQWAWGGTVMCVTPLFFDSVIALCFSICLLPISAVTRPSFSLCRTLYIRPTCVLCDRASTSQHVVAAVAAAEVSMSAKPRSGWHGSVFSLSLYICLTKYRCTTW